MKHVYKKITVFFCLNGNVKIYETKLVHGIGDNINRKLIIVLNVMFVRQKQK
jgi:hypothetical protein